MTTTIHTNADLCRIVERGRGETGEDFGSAYFLIKTWQTPMVFALL